MECLILTFLFLPMAWEAREHSESSTDNVLDRLTRALSNVDIKPIYSVSAEWKESLYKMVIWAIYIIWITNNGHEKNEMI
jgi:hypothetical protein